jgi:hypothetical protein
MSAIERSRTAGGTPKLSQSRVKAVVTNLQEQGAGRKGGGRVSDDSTAGKSSAKLSTSSVREAVWATHHSAPLSTHATLANQAPMVEIPFVPSRYFN